MFIDAKIHSKTIPGSWNLIYFSAYSLASSFYPIKFERKVPEFQSIKQIGTYEQKHTINYLFKYYPHR
jgi:hypothetical protein